MSSNSVKSLTNVHLNMMAGLSFQDGSRVNYPATSINFPANENGEEKSIYGKKIVRHFTYTLSLLTFMEDIRKADHCNLVKFSQVCSYGEPKG